MSCILYLPLALFIWILLVHDAFLLSSSLIFTSLLSGLLTLSMGSLQECLLNTLPVLISLHLRLEQQYKSIYHNFLSVCHKPKTQVKTQVIYYCYQALKHLLH